MLKVQRNGSDYGKAPTKGKLPVCLSDTSPIRHRWINIQLKAKKKEPKKKSKELLLLNS